MNVGNLLAIDDLTYILMKGAVIDYEETFIRSGFLVHFFSFL